MHLYKTIKGNVLVDGEKSFLIHEEWDQLINKKNLFQYLSSLKNESNAIAAGEQEKYLEGILAPIGNQEVWAAGVTYLRSRDARMEESKDAGGGDFYQKVYDAERPELFFKALPQRVSGQGQQVNIRKDSTWNVPEPELTLYINAFGQIQAYTVGNDMSSRSIEGENPLYLPQAKSYERCAALGPCLFVPDKPISKETNVHLQIKRDHTEMFSGAIQLNRMKRELTELAGFLFRECDFPAGCFLMTGTGIVPPDDFTLQVGDVVNIRIDGIGTLTNTVGVR
ncbi:MAG TPA: fumarylacetoacetate hydrolase family protein [Puia sp.]|nr:fumarylacetoacetate hydrolase family protein [Puia sp.]